MREIKILNTSYAESTADFIITNPSGFGNKFNILKVNDIAYDFEENYEDLKFDVTFGVDSNAYSNFNTLMNFLKNNKMVISYNYGTGVRYADVRLKIAPKTEKLTNSTIVSKLTFDRLTPWYEKDTLADGTEFSNNYPKNIYPMIEFTTSITSPIIKLTNETTQSDIQEIRFDFAGLTLPVTVTVDSENKTIKFSDGTSAYDYVNKTYNTFIEVPEGTLFSINGTNVTSLTYMLKQWVID